MYSACKWLFKKFPNVIVLVAGLWIASLPPTFADYVVGIHHRRRIYGRFEAFLRSWQKTENAKALTMA